MAMADTIAARHNEQGMSAHTRDRTAACRFWVTNGCADNMTGTSEVPQLVKARVLVRMAFCERACRYRADRIGRIVQRVRIDQCANCKRALPSRQLVPTPG
jgi:hypothetical protein